jgi:hypothetical protein
MGKFIKYLFILAFLGGILFGGSFLGVRGVAGRILGANPPDMGTRTIKFAFDTVPAIAGKQAFWTITYSPTKLAGFRTATIYITPMGHVIKTNPSNLAALLEQYAKSREPS